MYTKTLEIEKWLGNMKDFQPDKKKELYNALKYYIFLAKEAKVPEVMENAKAKVKILKEIIYENNTGPFRV